MNKSNDLKFFSKYSKITKFNLNTNDEHKTLNDFNWYFEIFSEFLKTKNILVFKNNSLHIEMTFVSDYELHDNFF